MKYTDMQKIHLDIPRSKNELVELIHDNENTYQTYLNNTLEFIASADKRIITLAGPSCSGKTTTADYLANALQQYGKHVKLLSIDDFFRPRQSERLAAGEKQDLDSVSAIDLDYFELCIDQLAHGKTAMLPTFDFTKGVRSALTPYTPQKNDIYMFEGIQAVYTEITELLDPFGRSSIFINVESELETPNCTFSKIEIRLIRRLLRDRLFRSAHCDFTLFQWSNVRENEERSILPHADSSDLRINSVVPYELLLYANRLPEFLDETPEASPHYAEAMQIKEKLLTLCPNPLDEELIPDNSLLREFIGRKN